MPGLPVIWADHDRLEQVFVNLLGNALGHNPPGTTVRVTVTQDGPGTLTVRVADDGEGLPPELARAVTEAAGQRDPRWHDVLAADTTGRGGAARAPGSACRSPAGSWPRTAAASRWSRRRAAPASW